jgi:hypothetical protein
LGRGCEPLVDPGEPRREELAEGLRRGGEAAGHADARRRQPPIISPSEAFLPPTCCRSVMRKSLSHATRIRLVFLSSMVTRRTVFFVSDGTGITAQMLGHSLLTQFEGVEFNQVTLPFIDSAEKAEDCLARISAEQQNGQPIVFSTLVNNDVRTVLRRADALFIDFFESFIDPLEAGLGMKSSHTIGRSHSAMDKKEYSSASRRSISRWRTTTAPRTASLAWRT